MDVYIIVKRKRTSFFTDLRETCTILELKKMVEGVLKFKPEDQQLSDESGSTIYEDNQTLSSYNLTGHEARAHCPAVIGLAVRDQSTGNFEHLVIEALSDPPPLPEIMRPEVNAQND